MPAGPIGSCWATGSWSDTAWEANTWADTLVLAFVFDINTRMQVYLCAIYSADGASDLTPKVDRFVDAETGEMSARVLKLIQDATDSMT